MTEKPLHVQVAEALGWTRTKPCPIHGDAPEKCWGKGKWPNGESSCVPHYDTDWSATGPLIEKYGVSLIQGLNGWYAVKNPLYILHRDGDLTLGDPEDTPLIAVCHLLLKLPQTFHVKHHP